MQRRWWWAVAGQVGVAAAWAGSTLGAHAQTAPAAAATARPVRAEVMHYWTAGSEARAMAVIAAAFQARGGQWTDHAVAGGDALRALAITRLQGGAPPTAMMWSIGNSVEELARNGLLNDMNAVARSGGWAALLPPIVLRQASVGGNLYAVPLNLHGENWLYASEKVLQAARVAVPQSWDELIAAGDTIRRAGFVPLALGGQPWQEVLLFRAILASQGGAELYRRVFVDRDPAAASSDGVRKAFETLARLKPLVDAGSPGRNWNDTTNLLIVGRAAFQVMGDWARGEFAAAGLLPGRDYRCSLPPGPGRGLIIATDVFVFPKTREPGQLAAQQRLAEVLLDKQVQIDFNRAKGSTPVRSDIAPDAQDVCARQAAAALGDAALQLPNAALSMSDDAEGGLEDLVTAFWNSRHPRPDDAAKRFARLMKAPR